MAGRRGFTLIELVVSMAVGLIILTAAVSLVTDQGRVLNRATNRMEMHQDARVVVDLLAQDLRHAGVGVGYGADGQFGGLTRGSFTVPGGARFVANDRQIALESGILATDDIGLRQAVGDIRTIAAFTASKVEICAGADYAQGDVVIFGSREGMHARTVKIGSLSASACSRGNCVGGCEAFSFATDASYTSDAGALSADYGEGEVAGDYQQVVWFVVPNAQGLGQLQRAEITTLAPCAAADASCGGAVADGVESLQMAVQQWDAATSAWVDRTADASISGQDRLRVDIELVMRARQSDPIAAPTSPVTMELVNQCVPAPCGTRDRVARWATRSSVEIRNSGRMRIH